MVTKKCPKNCETRDELLFCSLKLLLFYWCPRCLRHYTSDCTYLQYAYISNTKWNKTWQIKFVNRNSVLNYNISLSSWGKCSGICNSVQNRYLKKWNVSAVGSFTLRFSFKTKRDFRALKNWNIDWINVTLPVSVFLEASSFVDFVWSFTLLDVTSKINRSKIWIHIHYSIIIFSLLAIFGLSSAWTPHPCIPHASRACKLVFRQRLLTATSCNQTFRQTNPRTEHPFVFFLAGCSQRAKYLSHTQCICCASISLCYILSKGPLFNRGEDHKK